MDTLKDFKLPAIIKVLWVAALRSGLFIQGQGKLKSYHQVPERCTPPYTTIAKYCCLGVLKEIQPHLFDEVRSTNYLSTDAKSGLGEQLAPKDCVVIPEKVQRDLAAMNDSPREGGKRLTFSEIADYIEKNL